MPGHYGCRVSQNALRDVGTEQLIHWLGIGQRTAVVHTLYLDTRQGMEVETGEVAQPQRLVASSCESVSATSLHVVLLGARRLRMCSPLRPLYG